MPKSCNSDSSYSSDSMFGSEAEEGCVQASRKSEEGFSDGFKKALNDLITKLPGSVEGFDTYESATKLLMQSLNKSENEDLDEKDFTIKDEHPASMIDEGIHWKRKWKMDAMKIDIVKLDQEFQNLQDLQRQELIVERKKTEFFEKIAQLLGIQKDEKEDTVFEKIALTEEKIKELAELQNNIINKTNSGNVLDEEDLEYRIRAILDNQTLKKLISEDTSGSIKEMLFIIKSYDLNGDNKQESVAGLYKKIRSEGISQEKAKLLLEHTTETTPEWMKFEGRIKTYFELSETEEWKVHVKKCKQASLKDINLGLDGKLIDTLLSCNQMLKNPTEGNIKTLEELLRNLEKIASTDVEWDKWLRFKKYEVSSKNFAINAQKEFEKIKNSEPESDDKSSTEYQLQIEKNHPGEYKRMQGLFGASKDSSSVFGKFESAEAQNKATEEHYGTLFDALGFSKNSANRNKLLKFVEMSSTVQSQKSVQNKQKLDNEVKVRNLEEIDTPQYITDDFLNSLDENSLEKLRQSLHYEMFYDSVSEKIIEEFKGNYLTFPDISSDDKITQNEYQLEENEITAVGNRILSSYDVWLVLSGLNGYSRGDYPAFKNLELELDNTIVKELRCMLDIILLPVNKKIIPAVIQEDTLYVNNDISDEDLSATKEFFIKTEKIKDSDDKPIKEMLKKAYEILKKVDFTVNSKFDQSKKETLIQEIKSLAAELGYEILQEEQKAEDDEIRTLDKILGSEEFMYQLGDGKTDEEFAKLKEDIKLKISEIDTKFNEEKDNQKAIKSWDKWEVKKWSTDTKAKWSGLKKEGAIEDELLEAIAVLERANQLSTISDKSPLGHRLRNTQKVAIYIFAQEKIGHIGQIGTGEGKTTIVSFSAALRVLQGFKADIITSNQVLAKEGVSDKRNFYTILGITVAHNNADESCHKNEARKCYSADIVYGSMNNFQFDYLRDRFEQKGTLGDRKPEDNWLFLDEVDSLIIDQGSNIAKLSGPFPGMESLRYVYINIWHALEAVVREVSDKMNDQLATWLNEENKKRQKLINKLKQSYRNLEDSDIETDHYRQLKDTLSKADTYTLCPMPNLSTNGAHISEEKGKLYVELSEQSIKYKALNGEEKLITGTITNDSTDLDNIYFLAELNLQDKAFEEALLQAVFDDDFKPITEGKKKELENQLFIEQLEFSNNKNSKLTKEQLECFDKIKGIQSRYEEKRLTLINDLNLYEGNAENQEIKGYEKNIKAKLEDKIKAKDTGIIDDLQKKGLISSRLREYIDKSIKRWVNNAYSARYEYQEGKQYRIGQQKDKQDGEKTIIPVDNSNTGVSMYNSVLSNGLHQFLQIKHNVFLTFESLTSCYISNLGYVKKYGTKLLGVTGTLGSEKEQEMLGSAYNLHFSKLPTYKEKRFQEWPGEVIDDNEFENVIALKTLRESYQQARAALIICESIKDVNLIKRSIEKYIKEWELNIDNNRIKTYSDESESGITQVVVDVEDIIIATNISGRGTDFKTTEKLNINGGIHIIVAFLPCNLRVELQAFGRTARQGNFGTGALVIRKSEASKVGYGTDLFAVEYGAGLMHEELKIKKAALAIKDDDGSIEEDDSIELGIIDVAKIKKSRDELESERLLQIKEGKIQEMEFKDQLFERFRQLYGDKKKWNKESNLSDIIKYMHWEKVLDDLKETWAFWLEKEGFDDTDSELKNKVKVLRESNEDIKEGIDNYVEEKWKVFQGSIEINKLDEHGCINLNPYYLIQMVDLYIDKENFEAAKNTLESAKNLRNDSGSIYAEQMKFFEITIREAKVLHRRFKEAVEKVFVFGYFQENRNEYLSKANEYLEEAENELNKEANYLEELMKDSEDQNDQVRGKVLDLIIEDRENNAFIQHLESQLTCIRILTSSIEQLKEVLNEAKKKTDMLLQLESKVPQYFDKINQPGIKVTQAEKNEFNIRQQDTIYQLKPCYKVPDTTIAVAQGELAAGFVVFGSAFIFPPVTYPIFSPIAGALIGEGVTDIVMALIDQGESGFDKKSYWQGKAISLGVNVLTLGIGAIAQSTKVLKAASNACLKLGNKLKKLGGIFEKLGNKLIKLGEKLQRVAEAANAAKKGIEGIKNAKEAARNASQEAMKAAKIAETAKDAAKAAKELKKATDAIKQFQQLNKLAIASKGKLVGQFALNTAISVTKDISMQLAMRHILVPTIEKFMDRVGANQKIQKDIEEKVSTLFEDETFVSNLFQIEAVNVFDLLIPSAQISIEEKKTYGLQDKIKAYPNGKSGLFQLSFDVGEIIKALSKYALSYINDWRAKLLIMGADTTFTAVKISHYADKIIDKLKEEIDQSKNSAAIISGEKITGEVKKKLQESLSGQIVQHIQSEIQGLTSNAMVSVVQIAKGAIDESKYKRAEKKERENIQSHDENKAGAAIAAEQAKCVSDSLAEVTGLTGLTDSARADALNMRLSASGGGDEDIKRGLNAVGVDNVKTIKIEEALCLMEQQQSDRGIITMTRKSNGKGHAAVLVKEKETLYVVDQDQKTLLSEYQGKNPTLTMQVHIGENHNQGRMDAIRREVRDNLIDNATKLPQAMGQGTGQKYRGPLYREGTEVSHLFGIKESKEKKGIIIKSEDSKFKRALEFRDLCNKSLCAEVDRGMVQTLVEVGNEGVIKSITIHRSGDSPISDGQLTSFKKSVKDKLRRNLESNYGVRGNDLNMIDEVVISPIAERPRGNKKHRCALDNSVDRAKAIIANNNHAIGGEVPVTKKLRKMYGPIASSCAECVDATNKIVGENLPINTKKKEETRLVNGRTIDQLVNPKNLWAKGNPNHKKPNKGSKRGNSLTKKEYLFGDSFESYEDAIINTLLTSRLGNSFISTELQLLPAIFIDLNSAAGDLSGTFSVFANSINIHKVVMLPLLIKHTIAEDHYHWSGIIGAAKDEQVTISYLDSENQGFPLTLKDELQADVQSLKKFFSFNELQVLQQLYNNCGPELIENFYLYATGKRASQENAPYVHSMLWENTLLNSEIYASKILENKQLIKILSNEHLPLYSTVIPDYRSFLHISWVSSCFSLELNLKSVYNTQITFTAFSSLENNYHQDNYYMKAICSSDSKAVIEESMMLPQKEHINSNRELVIHKSVTMQSSDIGHTLPFLWLDSLLKQWVYRSEISSIKGMLKRNEVDMTWQEAISNGGYKKVALKLHPDKHFDNKESAKKDFQYFKEFKDKYTGAKSEQVVQQCKLDIYKASIGINIADTVLDAVKVYNEPTLHNTKEVVTGGIYIANLYYGFSHVSVLTSSLSIIYSYYEQGIDSALKQSLVSAAFMAAPYALAYTANPYAGLFYLAGITTYSAYNLVTSAYSLYTEMSTEDADIRSSNAYESMYQWMSKATEWYWFEAKAEEYTAKIQMLNLAKERLLYEQECEDISTSNSINAKTNIDNICEKVSEYIWNPYFLAKEAILNSVVEGYIRMENYKVFIEEINLVQFNSLGYDMCRKNIGTESENKVYYCWNKEENKVDKLVVNGEGMLFSVEHL